MEDKIKKIIEENPLATVNQKGEPHVIGVASVKVKDEKIIVTDNYMKTTIEKHKTKSKYKFGSME
jgi:hypothetical protein